MLMAQISFDETALKNWIFSWSVSPETLTSATVTPAGCQEMESESSDIYRKWSVKVRGVGGQVELWGNALVCFGVFFFFKEKKYVFFTERHHRSQNLPSEGTRANV